MLQKIVDEFYKTVCSQTIVEKILLLAPIMMWFSYYPVFHLGRQSGTNLEFSLIIIYVVILALIGLPSVWRSRRRLFSSRAVWLVSGYVLWQVISIIWAVNPLRAVLVSGLWGILFIDFLVIYSTPKLKELLPYLLKIMVGSAVVMSIIAIIQVAYGAWFDWGLCVGCLASGFGFVRPSVFTIEPQFFGSLLLAPILLLSGRIFLKQNNRYEFLYLLILLVALYLTLSRGAIYACLAAMMVQFLLTLRKRRGNVWISGAKLGGVVILAGFMGMVWHGIFTQLNPRLTDTFYNSVAKSANHLSLGTITITPKQESVTPTQPQDTSEKPATDQSPQKAAFDGYVERSTDERTNLSKLAVETWTHTLANFLFGVGVGGAGRAIFQQTGGTTSDFEIIQHEFLSIAVELGLAGLILFITIIYALYRKTRHYSVVCWGILTGFLVQWNFFSGLPNVLHIYLVGMFMFAIINRVDEKTECIN